MSIVNIQALKQNGCQLWWPGAYAESGAYDDDGNKRGFMILPDGVTVTPSGTFTTQKMKDGRNIWKFDGSTNYVILSTNAAWNFGADNFTISFWYKPSSIIGGAICGHKWDNRSWIIYQYATGAIELDLNLSDIVQWTHIITSPINTIVTSWTHFTFVRSGSTVTIYKDGIAITSNSSVSGTMYASTNPIHIGADLENSTVYRINGNIKDLMIFKGKALSQDQIAAIMAETYIY